MMINLLTDVSVAYAAVLVLALALILLAVWILLVRISRILARVEDRLNEVARHTQPLERQLGAITTAAIASADELSRRVDAFVAAAQPADAATSQRKR
jgi:uncharacterized protein YoxC